MENFDANEGTHKLWADMSSNDSKNADFTIIGVPFDGMSSCRKSAALAPERIRHYSKHLTPFSEDRIDLRKIKIFDAGDIIINDAEKDFELITKKVMDVKNFPIILGGDHSISIPIFKAVTEKYKGKKIGILWIDAHPDLCEKFNGSNLSHACPLKRAVDFGIKPENIYMVGVRSWEDQEVDLIKKNKFNIYTTMDVEKKGMNLISKKIINKLSKCDVVYLSIDIDSLDPAYAPGTGIPDCGGLTMRDLLALIKSLKDLNIIGMDLVEVAPKLDFCEITVFAALKILIEFIALTAKNKK